MLPFFQIRPCFLYEEEYDDCNSIKGRFHQYFIHGESTDCLQWRRDYDSCVRYERDNNDLRAAKEIIDSEVDRRANRMRAHYQNTVWSKRSGPPPDWQKPLPEWLVEKNRNTYLEIKQNEIKAAELSGETGGAALKMERSLCVIM